MLVTIVDAETTGTDPGKDLVIEVAAILYSLTEAAPVQSISTLCYCKGNPAQSINGIDPKLTWNLPSNNTEIHMMARIHEMVAISDAVLAHNAAFDKRFLCQGEDGLGYGKPWVCTMLHVRWPNTCASKSLVSIALAHGVGVVSAHRAMADCDTIARLLTRVHEMGIDLDDLMRTAMLPRTNVQALVSYDDRQLAKDAGFEWEPGTKRWMAELNEEEINALPFKVRRDH